MRRISVALLIAFASAAVCQTSPPATGFDVASIKANRAASDRNDLIVSPSRLTIVNFPLLIVIAKTYLMEPDQIIGPSWMAGDRFDIAATFPKGTERSQVREMLKTLLSETFGLRVHVESKAMPVYSLELERTGLQIKESSAHKPVNISRRAGSISATNMTMASLASMLSRELHRTVNDKTGLHGEYDLSLKWNPVELSAIDIADSTDASLFTALREQLGLKLDLEKNGSVDVLVVDHVARPSK